MSKFFVQMLLSVMVGVGAALGFSPDAKSELREAKAYLHERLDAVLENAHELAGGIDLNISARTDAQASAEGVENGNNAEVKVNSTLNVKSGGEVSLLDNWIPALSLDGLFSTKTQTDVETDGSNLDVGLKEKLNSTLGLGLGE